MSDRCESPLGRRRPFILALSMFALIGISLILNVSLIGEWFGDHSAEVYILTRFMLRLYTYLFLKTLKDANYRNRTGRYWCNAFRLFSRLVR